MASRKARTKLIPVEHYPSTAPIPQPVLVSGDRVGYSQQSGFVHDPACARRRGSVVGHHADLVEVQWDDASSSSFVQRSTIAKVNEQSRAWSRC